MFVYLSFFVCPLYCLSFELRLLVFPIWCLVKCVLLQVNEPHVQTLLLPTIITQLS